MNIPQTVKVGGFIFKIIRNYKFRERTDCDGQADYDLLEIRLKDTDQSNNELPQDKKEEIFLHELLHCINDIYNNGKIPEEEIKRISQGLFQVFKDNKL